MIHDPILRSTIPPISQNPMYDPDLDNFVYDTSFLCLRNRGLKKKKKTSFSWKFSMLFYVGFSPSILSQYKVELI